MQSIVIIGSSGHAKVVIDVAEKAGGFRVVGLIDDFRKTGEATLGYEVLGGVADLPRLIAEHGIRGVVVAVGDNFLRGKLAEGIRSDAPGVAFPTLVHPAASVGKDASIGEGAVLMAGAVVNPACRVGPFCILNTNSSLDHDSVMEQYASLAPRACTGGNTFIGPYAAVGIGATLLHGVRVGAHSVIGAGATVLEDVKDHTVALGTPAKAVKTRKVGERYL